MLTTLCVFFVISFFELRHLYKAQERKEAFIYIVIAGLAVSLAMFLILVPRHSSFAKLLFDILEIH